ncbi:hypothetical protein OpiT1DRAFT_01313 [Opitutaceae bacterium TAV1]|nr:hypothetical protein OpiT1DRAFT_01313 [Opitutaceae bacterium TAV1]
MAQLVSLLIALCKVFPAIESLARLFVSERDKAREAEAANRKIAKDKAVDDAIDNLPHP